MRNMTRREREASRGYNRLVQDTRRYRYHVATGACSHYTCDLGCGSTRFLAQDQPDIHQGHRRQIAARRTNCSTERTRGGVAYRMHGAVGVRAESPGDDNDRYGQVNNVI